MRCPALLNRRRDRLKIVEIPLQSLREMLLEAQVASAAEDHNYAGRLRLPRFKNHCFAFRRKRKDG